MASLSRFNCVSLAIVFDKVPTTWLSLVELAEVSILGFGFGDVLFDEEEDEEEVSVGDLVDSVLVELFK
jgi:hypothetical protein